MHGRLLAIVFVSTLCLLAASRAAAAQPNTLTAEELAEGWILLFDGETTYGWKANSDANWTVADGAISATEGERGLLNTTTEFGDYVLKVDFRAEPNTNSGIFLRTSREPTDPAADCYELNIAPADNPFPTGSLVSREKYAAAGSSRDWRTFEVTAQGGRFEVQLDGRKVLDYTDPKPLGRGYIGLQFRDGPIAFRNIKLKALSMKSIYSGKDLSGWKTDHARQSTFRVTADGAMNVTSGPGQIESEGTYADFVLQLEVISNGRELNSGIFFRSIPGDVMMGYESQIHNGFIDGDRARPKDCGTGGIFRRQDARRVVADDFKWFHKTIIADGSHMAVWVNGIQVSDWTDTRGAHENPRKGLRLAAGTFIIQGHDPTTDLAFRSFRVSEIPPRK